MHKIYADFPITGNLTLSEEESKHLCKVMRKTEGDQVLVLDGKGQRAVAEITVAHPKKAEVTIISTESEKQRSKTYLTIAIAPTKNLSRMEYFVEKATELGVDRIVPVLCHQSERRVLKTERLKKVAIAAMKQSGQLFLPAIDELTPIKEFISISENGFIAHCPNHKTNPQLLNEVKNQANATILIGPEGDFTEEEVNFALDNGYKTVSLGNSILRTETAGVYACSIINALS